MGKVFTVILIPAPKLEGGGPGEVAQEREGEQRSSSENAIIMLDIRHRELCPRPGAAYALDFSDSHFLPSSCKQILLAAFTDEDLPQHSL